MNNFLEKVEKKGPEGRKRSDRKGNRTRQKNKRGDSKVESNDSPEIPDRRETSDIPGLPSGAEIYSVFCWHRHCHMLTSSKPCYFAVTGSLHCVGGTHKITRLMPCVR